MVGCVFVRNVRLLSGKLWSRLVWIGMVGSRSFWSGMADGTLVQNGKMWSRLVRKGQV